MSTVNPTVLEDTYTVQRLCAQDPLVFMAVEVIYGVKFFSSLISFDVQKQP